MIDQSYWAGDFAPAKPQRIRLAVLAASVLGFILPLVCTACSKGASGKQVDSASAVPAPLAVRVVQVQLRQIQRNVESVGSLFAYEEVTVSSEVDGKVEQVLADVGDRVVAGQPIVKISPVELQLTLEQQRAALRQARARLGLAENGLDLKDIRDAAEVKRAAADLNDAEQRYNRTKTLFDQGLLPKQSYDEADARYKASKAAYDLAMQGVENLQAQVAQFRATAALAEKKLNDTTIRAPFAGLVKERTVAQGQYLKVQTPVMVIVNVDPLRVRLKVPEKMAEWIRAGQEVRISVEAYPNRAFTGKISRINPSVDQQTRAFEVEALIDNRESLLKPGFFVKAAIPSNKTDEGIFVPEDSLTFVYGVYKVYVVEGNTLKEKDVKLGERSSDQVEIIDGLAAGQRVAVPGKDQALKDGATVEILNQ